MKRLLLLLLIAIPALAQSQVSGQLTSSGAILSISVVPGTQSVGVLLSGTWNATVTLEQTSNGSTWAAVGAMTTSGNVSYSVAAASGTAGVTAFRARCSSYLSGVINVILSLSTVPAAQSGSQVNITNLPIATFPSSLPVTVGNFPSTQPVSGSVSVSGTVNVGNFPGIVTAIQPTGSNLHMVCDSGCSGGGGGGLTDAQLRASPVPMSLATAPTTPVTGTFWQATQPVSLSGSIPVTGTFWQATQPVSGTFWQATQPVSLSTVPTHAVTQSGTWTVQPGNTANTVAWKVDGSAVTQPISGAVSVSNFPATQPVSGSVSVGNFPATQAVSGTFWQATQPVSIASMPSTPVTGTVSVSNFPATQPVSIASMPSTPVTGTFFQSTQPVSIASMPSTPVTGTFFQATQPISATSLPTHGVNSTPLSTSTVAISAVVKASLTASSNVKASSGNVYALYGLNGAASVCWVQFINSASAGTLGTGVIFSIPLPGSTTQPVFVPLPFPINFSTGIAVGISTTATGATACGTAGNLTVLFL